MQKSRLRANRSQTHVACNLSVLRGFPPCSPFHGIGARIRYILWGVLVSPLGRIGLPSGSSIFGTGPCCHDQHAPRTFPVRPDSLLV